MSQSPSRSRVPFEPITPAPISLVAYDDTDAAGESRHVGSVVAPLQRPRLTIISMFTTSDSLRRFVWRTKPHCVECGVKLSDPALAGFLEVPDDGVGLACLEGCYSKAVERFNPRFDRDAALEREIAVEPEVRDLRLVPDREVR